MSQLVHRSDEAKDTIPTRQRSIRSTKASRYTLVSVSAAAANALLYRLLLANLASAALANFGAATMVVAPTYLVQRRWTWRVPRSIRLSRPFPIPSISQDAKPLDFQRFYSGVATV